MQYLDECSIDQISQEKSFKKTITPMIRYLIKLARVASAASLLLLPLVSNAAAEHIPHRIEQLLKRQLPASPKDVKTITTPNNVTVRYKEPGQEGVCETTPGVKSYSGYVDLDQQTHMFFWFFEARKNPEKAPITLWLNGGPGSDSLISLFEGMNALLYQWL